jgi:CubicO group peptidase (beta-lactamase class C family)
MLQIKRVLYIVFSKLPTIISVSSIPLLLFSCSNSTANKDNRAVTDSTMIALPAPGNVSKAEAAVLQAGCERWYDSVLLRSGFNGGIVVAKKGNIVFENYKGTGHWGGKDTVTANTPFHIASVSKTFTAMAVLKFWQDGKLNLDDELSKYFPAFNYPGVTVRSLLNHRSGLPNYVYFMETLGWDKTKYIQNEDVLNYLVTRKGELTNISSPNTHFTYCNTNYALLALLLEKVSGQKYPTLLQQLFFAPLQMKNSFVFDTVMMQKVNPSYDWRGRIMPFNFLDLVYGDKNIYSTPRELLLWDRALSSGKIFDEKTLEAAFTPYSNEKPGIRNYGLGWRMNVYPDGKKMIYHNGWWHGNNAAFIRLIQDSATIIVLSNKFNRGVYHAKDMANLFDNYGASEEEEEAAAGVKKADTANVSTAAVTPAKKAANKKIAKRNRKKRNPF